jgi:dipeptidyl aminopeptidase/acylaminoacyl peptidase
LLKKIIIVLLILFICGFAFRDTLSRLYQGFQEYRISKDRANHYRLEGADIQDITQKLIDDPSIPTHLKKPLIQGDRRIVIFKYLSGSDDVAGYFSYLTNGDHPLMIFLRGGNGYFGITRPNNRFSFLDGYNIVGTLYRGNIYGGTDEWGGEDVEDVENLIKFFPNLNDFTKIKFQAPYGMIGVSRGAMEMFSALSRSEYVKSLVTHAVSVSGNVDLTLSMNKRPDMSYLFRKKCQESNQGDFPSWIRSRDPIANASKLAKSLQVLLVYGLEDNRVFLEEQQNLKKALESEHVNVELVVIPGAKHGLDDHFEHFENAFQKFMRH